MKLLAILIINTSWKISSRYKIGDKAVIRGSYSTGFRAPALHQIFLSNIQTLVSGGTVSNQGTFNNVSPVIRKGLGVPQLHAETADNVSAGFTYKPSNDAYFSVDFYNVKVHNRVLFTGEIGFDGDNSTINPVEKILNNYNITSLKFFINAVNTETNGVDFVANYKNVNLGNGKLGFSLAANYNKTKIVGNIATPPILAANNYDIFNRKEQSRITSARPRTKVIAGINFKEGKLTTYLNNTYFGEVTWQHATDPTKDQTFKGKVLTDLIFDYEEIKTGRKVTHLKFIIKENPKNLKGRVRRSLVFDKKTLELKEKTKTIKKGSQPRELSISLKFPKFRVKSKHHISIKENGDIKHSVEVEENYFKLIKAENEKDSSLKFESEIVYADEIIIDENQKSFSEGKIKSVLVNSYERNPKARKKCIEHFGAKCKVCDFDFEKIYGEIGKGFIHVHHIKDISMIGKEYEVNPISDLIPVCPNCHSMLHKRKPAYSIEELKDIMN